MGEFHEHFLLLDQPLIAFCRSFGAHNTLAAQIAMLLAKQQHV
jgi:hypothetical protein